MSRVGKKIIIVPEGVEVKIDGTVVTVKGAKGEASRKFRPEFKIALEENKISVIPIVERKDINALWGSTRANLANMINGAQKDFERRLEIEGLGFKAVLTGQDLELFLGFTHTVKIKAPEGVKFSVEKNIIVVSGADIDRVSKTAALIKKSRPPEPYKGKGVRYQGEVIRRKEGKKAAATTA